MSSWGSHSRRALRWQRVAPTAIALVALSGCSARVGGSKTLDQANNDLRRENHELKAKIEAQSREIGELKTKLSEEALARLAALRPDVIEALPVCSGIEIGGLSGFEPLPPDAEGASSGPSGAGETAAGVGGRSGASKSVVVYVSPVDGRDRFVQVVGKMAVEAVWMPRLLTDTDEPAAGPAASDKAASRSVGNSGGGGTVLGRVTLTPAQLRDAYRADVLGTYYIVEMTMSTPVDSRGGTLVMRAEFADALTGKVWKAERVRTVR